MSEPIEPNLKVIENATRKDVRPGDHVVFRHTWKRDGLTVSARREGVAHHQDDGNWCTEEGMYITLGVGEDVTITIRRPVQELPTMLGTVIVPNDGCGAIEAVVGVVVWRASVAVLDGDGRWHAVWRGGRLVSRSTRPESITPGTWKVDDQ